MLFTPEYEAKTWETGSHKPEESKQTVLAQGKAVSARELARRAQNSEFAALYHAGSQTLDYYRDANMMNGGSIRGHGSNLGHGPGFGSQGSNPGLQQQHICPSSVWE